MTPFLLYQINYQPFVQSCIDSIIQNTGHPVTVIGDQLWQNCVNWQNPNKEQNIKILQGLKIHDPLNYLGIRRWFAVNDWLKTNDHEAILYSDSDVLWFEDPLSFSHVAENDITLSVDSTNGAATASCGRFSRRAISMFCEWYVEMARNGNKDPLGNDMAAWQVFSNTHPELKTGNTNRIVNGVTFDHHLACTGGWKSRAGVPPHAKLIKNVYFVKGKAFCDTTEGQIVRLVNIHFWFQLKTIMNGMWEQAKTSAK